MCLRFSTFKMNLRLSSSLRLMSCFWILCHVSQTLGNNISHTLDDLYIAHFGEEPPEILNQWYPVREVWLAQQIDHMKKLVTECHRLAGRGMLNWDALHCGMQVRNLTFHNPRYKSRMTEMIYFVEYPPDLKNLTGFFRVIEGLKPDCVFYVVGDEVQRDMYLDQHVCGIPLSLLNVAPTAATTVADWRRFEYGPFNNC